jgi:hypothetical protein
VRPRLLRRRCLQRLRHLAVPRPFDIAELCAGLASARNRPIRLLPMRLPPAGPNGLWIAGAHRDYVVYESTTSRPHREHIVMHEIGHLICDHRAAAVFPHLDPGVIRAVLARTRYSTDEEQEAEMIASLVLERADRSPAPAPVADPRTGALLARLAAAIDPHGRAADG